MDKYVSTPKHGDACTRLMQHPTTLGCFGSPQGPVYWFNSRTKKKMSYRGITAPLHKRFYSKYAVTKKPRNGRSSKETGTRVHRHIYHAVHCKEYCKCDKKMIKMHAYAKQALKCLAEMAMTPVACEVPVVSHIAFKSTRLDMICERWADDANAKRSVVISVKTGYRGASSRKNLDDLMFDAPLDAVPCTLENQDHLQGCCELAMLRRDEGIEFDDYRILYLGETEARMEPLAKWAMSHANQDAVLAAMGERVPPKLRKPRKPRKKKQPSILEKMTTKEKKTTTKKKKKKE